MLRKILKNVEPERMEHLTEILEDYLEDSAMFEIDSAINGPHMTECVAKYGVSHLEHDNGGHGEHWSMEDLKRQHLVGGEDIHEWDMYYVMNMLYADYCEIFGEDVVKYSEMAKKFIKDIDAPKDKVKRYFYNNFTRHK